MRGNKMAKYVKMTISKELRKLATLAGDKTVLIPDEIPGDKNSEEQPVKQGTYRIADLLSYLADMIE